VGTGGDKKVEGVSRERGGEKERRKGEVKSWRWWGRMGEAAKGKWGGVGEWVVGEEGGGGGGEGV